MMQFLRRMTPSSWPRLAVAGFLLVTVFLSSVSIAAASAELLVLYPEVRAPFSKVFDDITGGAKSRFDGNSTLTPLEEGDSAVLVVRKKQPDVILALGRRSLESIRAVEGKTPIILGALSGDQYTYPGIAMVPDPKLILDKLLLLSPSVGRVHVVKKPNSSNLQLKGAAEYLATFKKELIVHESKDIREAANIYARLIDEASEGDAIWILQDGSYVNHAILSLLLDAAWSKNLVVFSSNPLHVKRGALFAVYPDNKSMGESLGELANQALTGNVEPGMKALQNIFMAVNERTSNHLGISLSNEIKDNVDLLLPAR